MKEKKVFSKPYKQNKNAKQSHPLAAMFSTNQHGLKESDRGLTKEQLLQDYLKISFILQKLFEYIGEPVWEEKVSITDEKILTSG